MSLKPISIFELMENNKKDFTKNDKAIYAYVCKYPEDFADSSLAGISAYTGVSHASITRFIQKLGFSNLNEFRYQLSLDLQEKDRKQEKKSRAQIYGEALIETEKAISDKLLEEIFSAIDSRRNVSLIGFNLSRIPAIHLHYLLNVSTPYASRVLDADSNPAAIEENNVLIIFSTRRGEIYKDWLKKITENERKPYVVLVTMNRKHVLKKYADTIVLLPASSASLMGDVVNSDQLSFMFFNNLLDDYISKKVNSGK